MTLVRAALFILFLTTVFLLGSTALQRHLESSRLDAFADVVVVERMLSDMFAISVVVTSDPNLSTEPVSLARRRAEFVHEQLQSASAASKYAVTADRRLTRLIRSLSEFERRDDTMSDGQRELVARQVSVHTFETISALSLLLGEMIEARQEQDRVDARLTQGLFLGQFGLFVAVNLALFVLIVRPMRRLAMMDLEAVEDIRSQKPFLIDDLNRIARHTANLVERVKKEEQKSATFFGNVPLPLLHLNPETREIRHNRAYDEWLALTREEEAEVLALALREDEADQATKTYPIERGGQQRTLEIRTLPQDVAVSGVFVAVDDVTDRVERQRRERQRDRLEMTGMLTGGIAHDFRNLLTIIVGNAELLEDDPAVPSGARERAAKILTAADRGADMTTRLLAFARRQPLAPKPTRIGDLIADIEPLLKDATTEDVEIRTHVADPASVINVDPGQLEAALMNLVVNAQSAMPKGGRLMIEARKVWYTEGDSRKDPGVAAGEYAVIDVSDTGVGMSPEVVQRAFEPFFTTKETGGGSGMGLAMVYGFTLQSGGFSRIYSRPGEGTTVRLCLPCAGEGAHVDTAKAGACESNHAGASGDGETILVAEDDILLRESVTEFLEKSGYNVVTASNATEALQILRGDTHVDLLFSDVIMPGPMNGRELGDKARELLPDLKIVLTSGYTTDTVVQEGRLAHGVRFLPKPYRRRQLVQLLAEVLAEPGTGARS
ncbi:response regulator [Rhodovulum adriaticum]|uniref:histidine kinase n=1 Tax=Rhodovulum adriaticum TaxID=35804 RepID=A0A4R2NMF0_RHOAD|nr:response regulator [Rhodovulum adriaticum]MBK1635993.1 hypothetical protein [Rhodovulum adriaticum]TCP22424.1 signal transduction histidine kinase [Rhodovulum adriaticum]